MKPIICDCRPANVGKAHYSRLTNANARRNAPAELPEYTITQVLRAPGHKRPFDIAGWIVDNVAVDDVEIGRMDKNRAFLLPFGIDLRIEDGIASIESNLPEALPSFSDPVENGRIAGVVEGVEQLLLSLACVGIDLSDPQFARAIHDCVANLRSG